MPHTRSQNYRVGPSRGHRHAGGGRGPLPVGQAEHIAAALIEQAKRPKTGFADALEHARRQRERVSLRYFSWEKVGEHSYRGVMS